MAAKQATAGGGASSPFAPPVDLSMRLVRQFLFLYHRQTRKERQGKNNQEEAIRLVRLCTCILLPHLEEKDHLPQPQQVG